MTKISYIDLFCGIGGFHLAMDKIGAKCVFASEIDEAARKTYLANHSIAKELESKNLFNKDITTIDPNVIPNFDILCAGFPCQPFSQAGHKLGFEDARGTLFYNIAQILEAKKPKAFILENVRNLLKHNNGSTFQRMLEILTNKLDYTVYWKVIKASEHNLPQHRPRLYIVGFREKTNFEFPKEEELKTTMSDIFKGSCDKKIGFTLRVGGRNSPINDRHNWDGYIVNEKEHRISIDECKVMMGIPEEFIFPVSKTQAYKQLGNSVAVNVVYKIISQVKERLNID